MRNQRACYMEIYTIHYIHTRKDFIFIYYINVLRTNCMVAKELRVLLGSFDFRFFMERRNIKNGKEQKRERDQRGGQLKHMACLDLMRPPINAMLNRKVNIYRRFVGSNYKIRG